MLEIYCCYCFYDVCLISYDNDDTCTDLYKRLKRHILNQFETKKKKGFCGCSLCKVHNYRDIWFLRLLNGFSNQKRSGFCLEHVKNCLKNMDFSYFFSVLRKDCTNILLYTASGKVYQSCYFYWQDGRLALADFCDQCKITLMQRFSSHKISSNNNAMFHSKSVG